MTDVSIDFMERTAREAGELLMEHYACLDPEKIRHKGEIDLLTQADLDSEKHIVAAIRKAYPGHSIGAEEVVKEPESDRHWVIDPLDGTTNFAHALPVFSISIAYREEGQTCAAVVHLPYLRETFTALRGGGAKLNGKPIRVSSCKDLRAAVLATGFHYQRRVARDNNVDAFGRFILDVQGMRRMGCASVDLCYVACGRLDAYWEPHLSPHDVMAGALIVEEAGGRVTDYLGGADYAEMRRIAASNGILHPTLLERLEYIE
jgi:myo-inositol-1(or 4)-monophosphatase